MDKIRLMCKQIFKTIFILALIHLSGQIYAQKIYPDKSVKIDKKMLAQCQKIVADIDSMPLRCDSIFRGLKIICFDKQDRLRRYFYNYYPSYRKGGGDESGEYVSIAVQHALDIWTETMCKELNVFLQDKDNADVFLALFAEWASNWHAQPLHWLFGSMLDDFLGISENTNTKQLAKAYEKLAISGKVLTKEELISLVAQYTKKIL